ncbi:MAG: hypothetical protein HY811_10635 [Planctomycetes bacterium]|nr:hypothetical protein [Planctomycetota bacterium]
MNMKYIIVSLSLLLLITGVIWTQDKPAAKSDLPVGGDVANTKKTDYSADNLYQLTPEMKAGDKFEVYQSQEWKGNLTLETEGKKPSTYTFVQSIQNKYTENIISTGETVEAERVYTASHVKKSGLPTSDSKASIKDEDTSLKDRKLGLKIKDSKVAESRVISKEEDMILSRDVPYVIPSNEFDGFIAPAQVKVGDSWKIREDDFGMIIFREDYDSDKCSIIGDASLEEITDYKGYTCAKIAVKISAAREQSADTPQATVELTGVCYFDLENKIVHYVKLDGKFTLDKKSKAEEKTKSIIKVEGLITITSEVKKVKE